MFNLESAMAIREREDGLLEKDTFDLSSAVAIDDTPMIAINKKEEIPITKTNWILQTMDEANKQLQDLLTTPARILGTPHPPMVSGLGTKTIPDLGKWLMEKEPSGYKTTIEANKVPPEQKEFAQPAPNKPGFVEIGWDRPRWENLVEKGANLAVLGYAVKQGFTFIKNELEIRDLARRINTAATKMADEVANAIPKFSRARVEGLTTEQEAGWLKERANLIEGFQGAIVQKLSAFEQVNGKWQSVAEGVKNRNMVNLLMGELRAMGERGEAIIPKIGQSVQFTNAKGELLTGIIRAITGQRAEIDMAGRTVVATLSQLSLPKVEVSQPTEGKVDIKFSREGDAVGKEYHETVSAIDPKTGKEMGFVKHSYSQGESSVQMIEVKPEYRKKGVGLALLNELQSQTEKPLTIMGNFATKEGQALWKKFEGQSKLSTPTGEGQKPSLIEELKQEDKLAKLQEDYVRTTPIGKMMPESAQIKQELANEDFLIKTYESDISKLENQIKVEQFNTEAEKVKAQYKLEALKERYTAAKENQKQKNLIRQEVKDLAEYIQSAPKEDIAIEYQGMIEQLKSKFDLKNRQEGTIAKRESMKTFVERMKIEGKPIDIPAEKLAMFDKVNLKDMTLGQLREIKTTISNFEKLGKTKLKARKVIYETKKEKIKTQLLTEATPIKSEQLPKLPIGDRPKVWVERAIDLQNSAQKTGVGLTPIDGLADVTGMTQMKKTLDEDFSKYLTHNDEAIKKWYELTKDFSEKEFGRIGVLAASRQQGGLERLANSGITEEEVKALELTPAEEKAYQFVLDTFDKEFPAVKQYSKEVYNTDVGEQENYVSFMSDYEQMSDLEIYERFGQTPEQIATRKTKTVEQGFTKERAEISKIKLETNIDKIFRRHMDDVAYMLNTGKNIKMYFEIINSPEMREKLGDVGTLAWLQWLDLMARKGGTEGAKRIAALDLLRRNIGAGVLAFRVSSALVQFSSFADTIATIGAEWATKGATSISTSSEWRNFIMDNFPEVKKAIGDDIAFREFGEGFMGNLTRAGTKPLQVLDGLMRSTAAAGSYQKLCFEKGIVVDLKNPDPDLITEATRLMRQSQGSSFFKDQPLAITAGFGLTDNKSLNKTILTFQSFMLNRWDNINRQIWRMGIKEKDYGKAISATFWLVIVAGAVEEGIRRGARKITGALAKDKIKEKDFAVNSVLNMVQSVPLLGQLVSSIVYSSNPVPVIKTIEDLIGGLGSAVKGKATETKLRGAIRAIGASGSLVGIPGSSQAAQIVRGMIPKADKGLSSGSKFKSGSNLKSGNKLKR